MACSYLYWMAASQEAREISESEARYLRPCLIFRRKTMEMAVPVEKDVERKKMCIYTYFRENRATEKGVGEPGAGEPF